MEERSERATNCVHGTLAGQATSLAHFSMGSGFQKGFCLADATCGVSLTRSFTFSSSSALSLISRLLPGRCDLWGQSHQIFHILVVVGALAHLKGLALMADYRSDQGACPIT